MSLLFFLLFISLSFNQYFDWSFFIYKFSSGWFPMKVYVGDFLLADKDVVVLFLRGISWCGRQRNLKNCLGGIVMYFRHFIIFCMDLLFVWMFRSWGKESQSEAVFSMTNWPESSRKWSDDHSLSGLKKKNSKWVPESTYYKSGRWLNCCISVFSFSKSLSPVMNIKAYTPTRIKFSCTTWMPKKRWKRNIKRSK